jgi:hypothetical protein
MNPQVSIIPALAVAILGGATLWLAMLFSLRSALLVLAAMLFLAGISVILDWDKTVYRTWLLPIQAYRSQLYAFFGVVLIGGMIPRIRVLSPRLISPHAWILLAISVYAGVLRMYHVDPTDGIFSIGMAFCTIVPIALVLTGLLQLPDGPARLIRLIVWATLIWVGGVAVQLAVNPKLVLLGSHFRFTGLIANCNQAATMLSVVAVSSLWLSLNGRKAARPFYATLTGVFLVMLLWTGSRGGFGMFVLGAAAVLYGRAGRAILFLPVFAVVVYALLSIGVAANVDLNTDRLLVTANSRAAPWSSLLRDGLANPIFGVGPGEIEGSENSYLLGFASYGAFMVLLMLAFIWIAGAHCLKLWRLRRWVDPDTASLIDLCIGQHIMYFAGSVFEGFMQARVGSNLLVILIYGGIGTVLIRQQRATLLDPSSESEDEAVEALPEGLEPELA